MKLSIEVVIILILFSTVKFKVAVCSNLVCDSSFPQKIIYLFSKKLSIVLIKQWYKIKQQKRNNL